MIGILGAGAFGTALAIALGRDGRNVTLWARDAGAVALMRDTRRNPRLPDIALPDSVRVTNDLSVVAQMETLLFCTPMQTLHPVLTRIEADLAGQTLVACCKGLDLASGTGPSAVIARDKPQGIPAVLTGPSFATDIAAGLPTALTLACGTAQAGADLQRRLSTPVLRLYLSPDMTGAELGGALKNVIAIACGACIGAGLGDSARAALMTRGFAEMARLAAHLGADPQTLNGLSGLGDLVLTCTGAQSRNYRHGLALGRGEAPDPSVTVEGAATARAAAALAAGASLSLPITQAVAALVQGDITVSQAMQTLLARPLKEE